MRRVVVTGLGIISCIGNDQDAVTQSLKSGTSGIVFSQKYADMGFRHLVFHGPGDDQERFLRLYGEEILPRLRDRVSGR